MLPENAGVFNVLPFKEGPTKRKLSKSGHLYKAFVSQMETEPRANLAKPNLKLAALSNSVVAFCHFNCEALVVETWAGRR